MVDVGLGQLIARRAQLTPNRRALLFEGRSLRYGELGSRIARLAAAFAAGGIRRRDRVGFLGRNHPAVLETLFAAAQLGAAFVPLSFRFTGVELTRLIDDAGIHTLVVDDEHRPIIDGLRGTLGVQRFVGAESGAPGWESLEALIARSERLVDRPDVSTDDVALIMYTSGTTGHPRGAMLTHANIWWNNVNVLSTVDFGGDEVTLVVAPLFHIGGLNVNTILTWQKGGEVVLHRNFDPGAALAAIAEHRVTQMFGVPAMFVAMSRHPRFAEADLTTLRIAVVGGAPVPEQLLQNYLGRGVAFTQGYGLTETSPVVAFLAPADGRRKLGSAGLTPLYTHVAIFDEHGVPAPSGVRGEICVRGPNVMQGYWRQPDATAKAIDERGWLRTGDVGWVDEEGYLYVVDRLKDVVISGGEKVYPAEVERVLYEHPKVSEIAVIGLPDERWGEAVTAVVTVAAGHELELEELREFAGRELARFKLPIRLHTVAALPRNSAGKVLKFELRRRFAPVTGA